MAKRVLINGFGRMGRLFFRASFNNPDFEVVAINELNGDGKAGAHLLEFDSIHGKWGNKVEGSRDFIKVNGNSIKYTNKKSPVDIDVKGIDIVVECSGVFKDKKSLEPYYNNGVDTVLVSAPVKDEGVLNIVYGINDNLYNPKANKLITSASCTTNCLAPVVKVINEKLGIVHGSMTTIHDITNTQTIIDAPHKDLRRARACSQSLIPTTTGSATAITMIYPELKGKLNGLAVRVPLLNASLTDCVFEVSRETSKEEVNSLFKEASESYLKGILGYEDRPLVSVDYKDEVRSSVIDGQSTMVIDGTQVKILAWYDNEIGYVNRMSDLCRKVARSI